MNWFEIEEQSTAHIPTDTPEQSTFTENFKAAMGTAIREDLPITSRVYMGETRDARLSQLIGYYKSGDIPQEIWDYYWDGPMGLDVDGISEYARNDLGLSDIPTPQDYENNRNAEYADKRKIAQDINNRQGKWGMVGEFAGNMSAMAADPLYLASAFTGYGTAVTALKGWRVALAMGAARGAAVEMAIEGMAQPFVYNWKDEIDSQYSAGEALVNVLMAGGLGAVGGMAGATVAKLAKGAEIRTLKALDADEATNAEVVARADDLIGPEGHPAIDAPMHVLRKSDPEANAKATVEADEALENTTNLRDLYGMADDLPDDEMMHGQRVDDLVDDFDTARAAREAEAEANAQMGDAEADIGPEPKKPKGPPEKDTKAQAKLRKKWQAWKDAKDAPKEKAKPKPDEGVAQVTPLKFADELPVKQHLDKANAIEEAWVACGGTAL